MIKVQAKIEFEDESGSVVPYEAEFTAPDRVNDKDFQREALHSFAHLRKDLLLGDFFDELSEPSDLYESGTQRFAAEEVFTDSYSNRVNTSALWLEIRGTLIGTQAEHTDASASRLIHTLHGKRISARATKPCLIVTTLAVTSVGSLLCQASTCFRIGSKLRCIRSTPTELQSMSKNDFECFANPGVNTPRMAKTFGHGPPLEEF